VVTNNEEIKNSEFYGPLLPARPAKIALMVLTSMIEVLIVMQLYQSRCQIDLQMGCLRSIVYHADSNLLPTC
jgi:hypothetical protein